MFRPDSIKTKRSHSFVKARVYFMTAWTQIAGAFFNPLKTKNPAVKLGFLVYPVSFITNRLKFRRLVFAFRRLAGPSNQSNQQSSESEPEVLKLSS
jgi:hypothetical protein